MVEKPKGGAKSPPPQITFTEDDVKKIVDFINFVYSKMGFCDGVTTRDAIEFNRLYRGACEHAKTCENHIMELKAVLGNQDNG